MPTGTAGFDEPGAVVGDVEEDPEPQGTHGECLLAHGRSAEDREVVGGEREMRADALNDSALRQALVR
jgi:hypothetical protein